MSILKKITKKYKWLRFLNRKVTKLSVLGASLVGLCISSGASFAKYRDENYGNGNAGIAKLGEGYVYFDYERAQIPSVLDPVADAGYYAFMVSFRIEFSESEVARSYSLDLRISKRPNNDYNYEDYPDQNAFFIMDPTTDDLTDSPSVSTFKITLGDNNSGRASKVDNPLSDENTDQKWKDMSAAYNNITKFSYDTIYCAYTTNGKKDENGNITASDYKWINKDISSAVMRESSNGNSLPSELNFIDSGYINNGEKLSIDLNSSIHCFKLILFSKFVTETINNEPTLINESIKILTKLTITQEQVGE